MSIIVRYNPKNLTRFQYDESIRLLREGNHFPAVGLDYHVCSGTEGALNCLEVWDSREQFDALAAHLMPILDTIGIEVGQPEIIEVYNVIKDLPA